MEYPESDRLVKVTFEDRSFSFGYWLGNDKDCPVEGWMLQADIGFSDNGKIIAWEYAEQE
jgi:hypothetical protein